jgi:hypothetical protein
VFAEMTAFWSSSTRWSIAAAFWLGVSTGAVFAAQAGECHRGAAERDGQQERRADLGHATERAGIGPRQCRAERAEQGEHEVPARRAIDGHDERREQHWPQRSGAQSRRA